MIEENAVEESQAAAAVRQMVALIDHEFGPETFAQLDHYLPAVYLQRRSSLNHDLACLAARLRWKPHSLDLKQRLRERAFENGHTVREERVALASLGLLLAAAELGGERPLRLPKAAGVVGRRREWSLDELGWLIVPRPIPGHRSEAITEKPGEWVKGDDGKQRMVRPETLGSTLKFRWYCSAAKAAATATLMEDEWPSGKAKLHLALEAVGDVVYRNSETADSVEDAILNPISVEQIIAEAPLSPADLELLRAFLQTGSWPEAGRLTGVGASATRQRKARLLKKLRPE